MPVITPTRTPTAATASHDYLTEVLELLYPAPCSLTGEGRDRIAEYVVVPDVRNPKLLIPIGSRRIAAAAVRRFTRQSGWFARLQRDAVAAALRTGCWPAFLHDRVRVDAPWWGTDSIDAYIQRSLGARLSIGIQIGPAETGRKPVLQLLTADGWTAGFAKLGAEPLTRRLVRAETAALAALAHVTPRQLAVPSILHTGQWLGHQVLVQSALPAWRHRAPLTKERLTAAMLEVAYACGSSRSWLTTSRYWADLRSRLAGVIDQPGGGRLYDVARVLVERCGDIPLTFGAWHGDWSPRNMANIADSPTERLLVWGWERFASGVPVGFDALHHELHRRVQTETDARACVRDLVAQAPTLLDPFDVVHDGREATALLYLVDLAARHLGDRRADAGAGLDVLLPVLVERVGRLA